ncbi:MAG TPA: hypothetical protein VFN38_09940, partial [Gemmatimonadaceae bacterium]|nr:hypothetical protein [Gemmatimonadaceae bacterium]
TAEVGLRYSNVRRSLGAVDDEKGTAATAVLTTNTFEGRTVPQLRGTFDFGFALPPHASIWSRTAIGAARGDRTDSAANFYFGAFGNNYVDHKDEQRYREYQSLPGLEINEAGGRNFVKSLVEWTVPPVRFSRAGTPGFYLTWVRPSVFVSGLVTNLDARAARRKVTNAGAQLDFRLSALSSLDLTLSVGGAVAFTDGSRPRREAMISLKVLR